MAAHAPFWLAVMREAALIRHAILVRAWYSAGPRRDEAMRRHTAIVSLFYGF